MSKVPPANDHVPEPTIAEILGLLGTIAKQLAPENSESWEWMIAHSRNPQVVEILRDSTFLSLRVLDAIGRLAPVNGITVSRQFGIPKGSVSKVTRRLSAQKLILAEPLPGNKKEIFFRLTPLGEELCELHRAFDRQMERGFVRFLQKYDAEQLQAIVRLLQEVSEASFLALGAEP